MYRRHRLEDGRFYWSNQIGIFCLFVFFCFELTKVGRNIEIRRLRKSKAKSAGEHKHDNRLEVVDEEGEDEEEEEENEEDCSCLFN